MITILFSLLLVGFDDPPDGTLLFIVNGKWSKYVEEATGSNISHVAIIFHDQNKTWVYESAPKTGVARTQINHYFNLLDERAEKREKNKGLEMGVVLIRPSPPFSQKVISRMKAYADSQLGRPYAVRGYWKDKEVRGIHCSQYVGNVLEAGGLIISEQWKQTPVDLYKKAVKIY